MKNNSGYLVSFGFQSFFFLVALFSVAGAFTGEVGLLFWAVIAQFFLGITQVIIGIVHLATFRRLKAAFQKQIAVYWGAVLVWLVAYIVIGMSPLLNEEVNIVMLFGIPWTIAIYFYIITIKQAWGRQKAALPHIDMPGFYERVNS